MEKGGKEGQNQEIRRRRRTHISKAKRGQNVKNVMEIRGEDGQKLRKLGGGEEQIYIENRKGFGSIREGKGKEISESSHWLKTYKKSVSAFKKKGCQR